MVVDLISGNFKGLFAVKSVNIDDSWDQMNRNYMVMFCIMSGTIMTLRQVGSVPEFDALYLSKLTIFVGFKNIIL